MKIIAKFLGYSLVVVFIATTFLSYLGCSMQQHSAEPVTDKRIDFAKKALLNEPDVTTVAIEPVHFRDGSHRGYSAVIFVVSRETPKERAKMLGGKLINLLNAKGNDVFVSVRGGSAPREEIAKGYRDHRDGFTFWGDA